MLADLLLCDQVCAPRCDVCVSAFRNDVRRKFERQRLAAERAATVVARTHLELIDHSHDGPIIK